MSDNYPADLKKAEELCERLRGQVNEVHDVKNKNPG